MVFGVDRRKLPPNANLFKHQNQAKHHNNNSSMKPPYFCDHYEVVGHSIDRCFKIHGYPNKSKTPLSKKYDVVAHTNDPTSAPQDGLFSMLV